MIFILHKKKLVVMILAAIIAALQYRLLFASDGLINAFRLKNAIREQQARNDDIIKRNAYLVSEIDSLKQGGVAIENRARSDLGMVKKGEIFYQVQVIKE